MDAEQATLLVVDDDAAQCYTIVYTLQRAGYLVRKAATGAQALAELASAAVDALIVHVRLPDLSGCELLNRLHADPATAALPILLISAYFNDPAAQEQIIGRSDADACLPAPVHPAVLLASIRALLRAQRAEHALRHRASRCQILHDPMHQGVACQDAENAVRESHERFRILADATFEGVCVSRDGIIRDTNEPFAAMLGYQREELLGRPLIDLIATEARATVDRAIRTGEAADHEHEMVRKDGSRCTVEAHGRSHPGGLRIAAVRDITARKQAEQALCRARDRLAEVLESITEGYYAFDTDWRFIEVNEYAAQHIFRTPREQLLGKVAWDLWPSAKSTEFYTRFVNALRENQPAHFEAYSPRFKIWLEIHAYPREGFTRLDVFSRNITSRKNVEDELRRHSAIVSGAARIFREALSCETEEQLGKICLAVAQEVTASRFGFIAQINPETGLLDNIAISDPGWDACRMHAHPGPGRQPPIAFVIHGLYGRVIDSATGFFTNDPASHEASIGLPPGHPPLTSFLGVPLFRAGKVFGIIGLGNRDGGYRPEDLDAAESLAQAIVQAFTSQRAEEALRQSELFYRQTLESIPGMVFTTGANGYVDYQSLQWVEFTGIPMCQHLGDGWNRLLHPEDRARAFAAWQAAVKDLAPYNIEYRVRHHDGHYEWFKVLGRPICDASGQIVRWFGVAANIDELKQAEAALAAAKQSADKARTAAESASKAKDQFIAVLSHELRTPLTPALAAVSVLVDDKRLPGEIREDLEMVRRNIALEVRLIADLLDVSRIISGKLHIERREVDVALAIREAAAIVSGDLDAKNQKLILKTPGAPYLAWADAARLQQVFWNLLRNAIKFSPEGSTITLGARLLPVQCCPLAAQPCPVGFGECPEPPPLQTTRNLVVQVIDAGPGITPEVLPRLFHPFEQGQEARTFGGLGLGLSICRAAVELHGGTISAHSEGPGRGATFTVTLPVAQCPLPALRRTPRSGEPRPTGLAATLDAPLKILLVEDHPDTARLLSRLLASLGHDVSTAATVADALLAADAARPDVLISDLGLPDGTGLDLMHQLLQRGRSIPAIALSGYGTPADIARSRAAGFAEHLVKPLGGLEVLTAALARLNLRAAADLDSADPPLDP